MLSKTPKAAEVRAYFVAVEASLFKYREDIIENLSRRIGVLERNQRAKSSKSGKPKEGVIYVLRASETMDSVYKIGRTTDLSTRLRSHGSPLADSLDVVYIYKTRCLKKTEACLKMMLKERQYRKYKEVYQVDLELLKEVLAMCDQASLQTLYYRPKRSKQTGGFYAVLSPM